MREKADIFKDIDDATNKLIKEFGDVLKDETGIAFAAYAILEVLIDIRDKMPNLQPTENTQQNAMSPRGEYKDKCDTR